MGDLIPIADYARGDRVLGATADDSQWLRPSPDWDPCGGCEIRSACREVRECYDTMADPPDIVLRLVDPPDIIA